jgi:Carboxypeptidase regulatory-like domain
MVTCAFGPRRLALMCALALTLIVSRTVDAQQASSIAGLVRDTSGGVLPGVTVEVTSPALIEKVRTAVADGEGRYNITDLRPGTYTVTFTLEGFNVLKRDGITLTAGFTATVNADMQVGSLAETITVTGAAPLVDTANVRQQESVSDELLNALPSGSKGFMGLSRLIPGMSGNSDSGGASGIYSANSAHAATVHGKGGGKMSYDGMQTSNQSGTGHTSYVMNPATVEETVILTGGISAESDASGLLINLVPKEGGNTFRGGFDGVYTNENFQSDNLSQRVRDRGTLSLNKAQRLYDANGYMGGPIKRDRLWFFEATRFNGSQVQVAGVFFNATQGTPIYTPDLNRPAFRREWLKAQAVRLTWQVSPRNKINVFSDTQSYQVRGRGGPEAPESQTVWSFWPNGLYQVTWNSPLTAKLLFEAGAALTKNGYPYTRQQVTDIFGFEVKETDVAILEASTGFRYNAKGGAGYANVNDQDRYVQRFSVAWHPGPGGRPQSGPLDQSGHRVRHAAWSAEQHRPVGHSDSDPRADASGPGPVRPGSVDDQPNDRELGPEVRLLQRARTRAELAGRPFRGAARVSPGRRRAELEGPQSPVRRVVRSLRQRTDRTEGVPRPLRRQDGALGRD